MKINRNPEGLRKNVAICKSIQIDEPRQDIIKSSITLIHEMIQAKQPDQILNQINMPKRSSGNVYVKGNLYSARSRR